MQKRTPYFADYSSDLSPNRPQLKLCFPKVVIKQICLLLRPKQSQGERGGSGK
jgi:hypothetical protein